MENTEQVQNPLPQSPTVQPVEQKPYGKRNWKKWILIYFVIAAIMYAGIYYFFIRIPPNFHSDPFPVVTEKPSLTPDPTANWKTYANTAYSYNVKYPSNWQIVGNVGTNISEFSAPYIQSSCNYETGQICSQLLIEVNNTDNKLEPAFLISPIYDKVLSRKILQFDTEKAQEIILLAGNQSDGVDKLYYVLVSNHASKKYTIRYEESAKNRQFKTPLDWQNKSTFDQILQTFKFTDQTIDTTNWKEYVNENLRISFRYPSSWKLEAFTNDQQQTTLHRVVDLKPITETDKQNHNTINLRYYENPQQLSVEEYAKTNKISNCLIHESTDKKQNGVVEGIFVYYREKGFCEPLEAKFYTWMYGDKIFQLIDFRWFNAPPDNLLEIAMKTFKVF